MATNDSIKIIGIKRIAGDSKMLPGYYSGQYIQVNYDTADGRTWGDYHVSLGHNSWTQYHSPSVINVGNIYNPVTMAEVREMIVKALHKRNAADG